MKRYLLNGTLSESQSKENATCFSAGHGQTPPHTALVTIRDPGGSFPAGGPSLTFTCQCSTSPGAKPHRTDSTSNPPSSSRSTGAGAAPGPAKTQPLALRSPCRRKPAAPGGGGE